MVLADTAFGSVEFLHEIRQLKYHAITGMCERPSACWWAMLETFTQAWSTSTSGRFPVSVSWYYLKRENGKRRKTICSVYQTSKQARLHGGETEMADEGWFKTAKHRFGLHRFGQGTLVFIVG